MLDGFVRQSKRALTFNNGLGPLTTKLGRGVGFQAVGFVLRGLGVLEGS